MVANSAQDHEEHVASTDEMLQGQLELWQHAIGYIKSEALECVIALRIPDAIVRCGGAATLGDILTATKIPPSNLPYLRRLMRALTTLRMFAVRRRPICHGESGDAPAAHGDPVYELTAASRRLITTGGEGSPVTSLLPSISDLVEKRPSAPALGMADWMRHEHATTTTPFRMIYGSELFEFFETDPAARARFDDGMAADSSFVMHALLTECPSIFHGLTSIVDVGGGARGAAAAAITRAFPEIKCTVLDLPYVVAEGKKNGASGLSFVAGDMYEYIPPADAALLKMIFHDWDDDKCVKILRQCKKAITHGDSPGKVIIVDVVIGSRPNDPICMERLKFCAIFSCGNLQMDLSERSTSGVGSSLKLGFVITKSRPLVFDLSSSSTLE